MIGKDSAVREIQRTNTARNSANVIARIYINLVVANFILKVQFRFNNCYNLTRLLYI